MLEFVELINPTSQSVFFLWKDVFVRDYCVLALDECLPVATMSRYVWFRVRNTMARAINSIRLRRVKVNNY